MKGPDVKWGGYTKAIAQRTKTLDGKGYFIFQERLRNNFDVKVSDELRARVDFDQETFQGNGLNIESVRGPIVKGRRDLLDVSKTLIEDSDFLYRFDFYRAFLSHQGKHLHMTVGRQRINWQKTRFWNPADVWNPLLPTQIETDERPGVDAVHVQLPYAPNPQRASLEIVFHPERSFHHPNYGFRLPLKVPVQDFVWEFIPLFAEFKRDEIYGIETRGQIGGIGVNSETVLTHSHDQDENFLQASVEGSYAWPNGVTVSTEYFYNGGNEPDPTGVKRASASRIFTTQRHFVNGSINYEYSTVLQGVVAAIYDVEGNSFFVNPRIQYNLLENLDLIVGTQVFLGSNDDTEFGILRNLYYAWLQYFF